MKRSFIAGEEGRESAFLKLLPLSPFLPSMAILQESLDLTPDVKLLRLQLTGDEATKAFSYKPGQFAFVSAFGVGESPFCLSSCANPEGILEFALRKVGTVSSALQEMDLGSRIGVRGPFGNNFPLEKFRGKNILIIGGGIGMAPLRPLINTLLKSRTDYREILIVNGARSPQDLVFVSEIDGWKQKEARVELTVDKGDSSWTGRVALVPSVVEELKPPSENAVAITCGPPIMIRFVLVALKKLGFKENQIFTTLESKMKCGLGKCARCNVGNIYVCQDGPVFSLDQISQFLESF